MKPLPAGLWPELIADLQDGRVIWQLVAIGLCLVMGWGIGAAGRRSLRNRETSLVGRSIRPLSTIVAPLVAAVLLAVAKPLLAAWIGVSLITLAVALLLSFALIRAVFYVLRRVFARSGHAGSLLSIVEKLFAVLVWLGVTAWVTGLWPQLHGFLAETLIPLGRHKVSLLIMLQAGTSVAVTLMLAMWAGALLEERLMRVDTVHSSLRVVMARTMRAMLVLVAVLVSLSLVGIDLTVLSVFGGALGVGLGLGLQKIVGSYVSGFVILLERSLTLGDIVKVDQFQGQVTRISSRYTVLRGADGAETVVPNDMLISQVVQNFSLSDRKVRLASALTVSYETDLQLLTSRLVATISAIPRVIAVPAPEVLLLRFGTSGLELECAFWIEDPENGRARLLSEVNNAIWALLQELCISVSLPQREIRVVTDRSGGSPNAGNIAGNAPSLKDLA